jgi:hypothetical protein
MNKTYVGWTSRDTTKKGYADLDTRFSSYNTKAEGLVADSVADDRNALNTLANVTMQPNGGQLDVVGVPRIASNITIPKNVKLRFLAGAYLAPDVGATVTILGAIAPTFDQIFGGPGTPANSISFTGNRRQQGIHAVWFGVQADDATDDTAPMKAAAFAVQIEGQKVFLPRGPIKITDRVDYRGGSQPQGDTLGGTIVKQYSNKSALYVSKALGARNLRFTDIQIVDAFVGVRTVGYGLELDATPDDAIVGTFERILTSGFMAGCHINRMQLSSFRNCSFVAAIEDGCVIAGICTSTTFETCYFNGNLRYGFNALGGCAYVKLIACAADGNGSDPYHWGDDLGGSLNCTMDTCGAEGNVGHAIYLKSANRFTIIEPMISGLTGALKDAIRLDGNCSRITVLGGLLFNTTGYAVNLIGAGHSKIRLIDVEFSTNALGGLNDPNGVVVRWEGDRLTVGKTVAGAETSASVKAHLGDNIGFAANVGGGEDDLLSFVIPAKLLFKAGQKVLIEGGGPMAANANAKQVRVYLGTEIIATIPSANYNNCNWSFYLKIHRIDDNSQWVTGWIGTTSALGPMLPVNYFATRDLTTALTIKVTGAGVADNDIVQRILSVDVTT